MRPNFFFKNLEWRNGKLECYLQAHFFHPQKPRGKYIALLTLRPQDGTDEHLLSYMDS